MARAGDAQIPIAIAGGQHSMGGQQFARDAMLIDTRSLDRVLAFDRERGLADRRGRDSMAGRRGLP